MDRDTTEEIKRHFNVVAESLRTEIRTLADGQLALHTEMSAEFSSLRSRLERLEAGRES